MTLIRCCGHCKWYGAGRNPKTDEYEQWCFIEVLKLEDKRAVDWTHGACLDFDWRKESYAK